jgi:hypothetical protein
MIGIFLLLFLRLFVFHFVILMDENGFFRRFGIVSFGEKQFEGRKQVRKMKI